MSWGPLQILLILLIVVLLFGTKKLRNLGADLGSSIKSFKKSMSEGDKEAAADSKAASVKSEEFAKDEQRGLADKEK